ncbi:MAG: hypothetical protein KDD84_01145 [Caldilineaceae bacterium]|nr:hypothetical protein [Caldilineaceae bacterium]
MSYRLLIRRIVLEVIDILTISIQPAHADRAESSPQRRKEEEEEEEARDTDYTDLKDSESSENPSGNPLNL